MNGLLSQFSDFTIFWDREFLKTNCEILFFRKLWSLANITGVIKLKSPLNVRDLKFFSGLLTFRVFTRLHLQGKVARRAIVLFISTFLKPIIVQNLKHTLCTMLILKSEHLEHGFATFALSICVPNYKNLTFWAKYHGRTDTDRQTDGHDSHIFILDPVCISRTQ